MRASTLGVGYVEYVGCVSAACIARMGHDAVRVDSKPDEVSMVNAATLPLVEQELDGD